MKLRWLLTAVMLTLLFYGQQLGENPHIATKIVPAILGGNDEPTVSDLLGFYEEYNQQFFGNKLPENTTVDYSEADGAMARTTLFNSGRYHIGLNRKYSSANRTARLMVLHEMCHIKYFSEADEKGLDHGPLWRSCMLTIELQGANRAILIDRYQGQ